MFLGAQLITFVIRMAYKNINPSQPSVAKLVKRSSRTTSLFNTVQITERCQRSAEELMAVIKYRTSVRRISAWLPLQQGSWHGLMFVIMAKHNSRSFIIYIGTKVTSVYYIYNVLKPFLDKYVPSLFPDDTQKRHGVSSGQCLEPHSQNHIKLPKI